MTAPVDTNETTVRKRVIVDAPIEHAFEVFTTRFDTWWPRSHHIGSVDMAEAILEERDRFREGHLADLVAGPPNARAFHERADVDGQANIAFDQRIG